MEGKLPVFQRPKDAEITSEMINEYHDALNKWIDSKLSRFDNDQDFRQKKLFVYGTREGYEEFLQHTSASSVLMTIQEHGGNSDSKDDEKKHVLDHVNKRILLEEKLAEANELGQEKGFGSTLQALEEEKSYRTQQTDWTEFERALYKRYVFSRKGNVEAKDVFQKQSSFEVPSASQKNTTSTKSDDEASLLRLVSFCDTNIGANHPRTSDALASLGRWYSAHQRSEDAELCFMRSLAIRDRSLGLAHPDTAAILHDLADLYVKEGRVKEAENLFLKITSRLNKEGKPHSTFFHTTNEDDDNVSQKSLDIDSYLGYRNQWVLDS
eukprot:g5874.t1